MAWGVWPGQDHRAMGSGSRIQEKLREGCASSKGDHQTSGDQKIRAAVKSENSGVRIDRGSRSVLLVPA